MSLKDLAFNLLFPPKCSNCHELLDVSLTDRTRETLCPSCRVSFENERNRECADCGLSMRFCRCMPKNMSKAQCSALLKLISYRPQDLDYPISQFLYSVKRRDDRGYFDFVADQMRALLISELRARSLMPDECVITFLPRSSKNYAEHGFDQGLSLARALSNVTGIKMVNCFKRGYFSKEQKSLNQYERRLNMNSAFTLRDVGDDLEDKTVILVDDIVTTGASMASCARMVYSIGAYDVFGISIAVTEKVKNNIKNKRSND